MAVETGTLAAHTAEEEVDWSSDEPEFDIAQAVPAGEDDSKEAKKEDGAEESRDDAPPTRPRKRVLLATGHLALLRELAAANASNWASIKRTLRDAPAEQKDKDTLIGKLEELAGTFAQNRDECARAAAAKTEELAELEEAEAEYLARLPASLMELERRNPVRPSVSSALGWVEHEKFKRDVEASGIWVARRREKARRRAAKHRAELQTEAGVRAGAEQDPVENREDAAQHLDFQMQEAARRDIREFRAELRREAPQVEPRPPAKRAPESERRRKIKWTRFQSKLKERGHGESASSGKSTRPRPASGPAKYDPRESEQNHPFAHTAGSRDSSETTSLAANKEGEPAATCTASSDESRAIGISHALTQPMPHAAHFPVDRFGPGGPVGQEQGGQPSAWETSLLVGVLLGWALSWIWGKVRRPRRRNPH